MARQKASQKAALTTRSTSRREIRETQDHEATVSKYPRHAVEPIVAKNDAQRRYISAINTFTLTFATGSAGTGKTYLAAALAAEALEDKIVGRIIITRPAVEAGESLGFLPGEIEQKFDPYLAPFKSVLEERLGRTYVEYLIKTGKISAMPLAYMRGHTFNDSFVILDEAQNTTPVQMKMFLTRIGRNSKVVINGDTNQTDIRGPCGLTDAVLRCSWIPNVKVVTFKKEDIVRSGIVQDIVEAYEPDFLLKP